MAAVSRLWALRASHRPIIGEHALTALLLSAAAGFAAALIVSAVVAARDRGFWVFPSPLHWTLAPQTIFFSLPQWRIWIVLIESWFDAEARGGERRILVHGVPAVGWPWLGALVMYVLASATDAASWVLIVFSLLSIALATLTTRLFVLSPDHVEIGRSWGRFEDVNRVLFAGDALELTTRSGRHTLRFGGREPRVLVGWLCRLIRARIGDVQTKELGAFRSAPTREARSDPTPRAATEEAAEEGDPAVGAERRARESGS